MAQYLLSVFTPAEPGEFGPYSSQEEMEAAFARTGEFNDRLQEGGYWVYANGLMPPESASTVDARAGEPVITDGPFLETKEHIGGFWIIEAEDLDVALRLAAEGSRACGNVVEVRPVEGAEEAGERVAD